jgi:ATP-binding cassette, subfamily C (CFTR/MRP), member 1
MSLTFLALRLSDLISASLEFSGIFDLKLLPKVASFVAAVMFCILSFVEHRRSATPSTLLVLYILACLLGHGVELLVLSPIMSRKSLSFQVAHIFLELAVLVVECKNKYAILLPEYQQLTPEEQAGILGRAFFWWINPLVMKGYQSILTDADLPRPTEALSSKKLRRSIMRSWDQRGLRCFLSSSRFCTLD